MKKIYIQFNDAEEIKDFANKVMTIKSDVNMLKGSIIVDAKSIMGIMALSSNEGVYVEILSDDKNEIADFYFKMKCFEKR